LPMNTTVCILTTFRLLRFSFILTISQYHQNCYDKGADKEAAPAVLAHPEARPRRYGP
jgi:hypothetical protein